ncbi:MAG: S1C family serine protease [Halobacteria archaeon]
MSMKLGAFLLVIGVMVGGVAAASLDTGGDSVTPEKSPVINNQEGGGNYSLLYEEIIDSVVSIRTEGKLKDRQEGSGFVYDYNGHVVTNLHVVKNIDNVMVLFNDGEWREAKVVGRDIYTDLAVLEVNDPPEYAEPLPLANSTPKTGTKVAALGNPLGLEGSISSGIVSGVNREMISARNFAIPDSIQTDAAVNPGNSGGPLVNLNGKVVGVNRAKRGDNIGFAISTQLVEKAIPSLIKNGEVNYSYMGVRTRDITPLLAKQNGLDKVRGILVVSVLENGPSSGVLEASQNTTVKGERIPVGGDVILEIGNTTIDSNERLAAHLMTSTEPGDTVPIKVLRDGEKKTVEVKLGERPSISR